MRTKKKDKTEDDLEKIHEFLESARASVLKGVALEQEFDGFYVAHDG